MLMTDCSPKVGNTISGNPGANGAIVLAKHVSGHCSDQNEYYVACFMPNNTATPFVVWSCIANEQRYEVSSGDYCFNLEQLADAWRRKTNHEW